MMMLVTVLAFVALAILVWKLWKPVVRPPKKEVPVNEAPPSLLLHRVVWLLPEGHARVGEAGEEAGRGRVPLARRTSTSVKIDADKDQKTATLYGINAYPTVVLETRRAA
jgi:hypothetical protein